MDSRWTGGAVAAFGFLLLLVPALASAEESTVNLEVVKGYLEALHVTPEVAAEDELRTKAKADGQTYELLFKVDAAHSLVYMAVTDLRALRSSDPAADLVLRRMASLNYDLVFGKLEWNEKAGEVRLSYSFSTEDGLGRRAFTGVLATLLQEAGPVRRELDAAAAP